MNGKVAYNCYVIVNREVNLAVRPLWEAPYACGVSQAARHLCRVVCACGVGWAARHYAEWFVRGMQAAGCVSEKKGWHLWISDIV